VEAGLVLDPVSIGAKGDALAGRGGVELGETTRMPSGMARPGSLCQPRRPARPVPASRAKSASSCSKSGLSMPVARYQKLWPVAGETKAMT
jgi:hypothetical protein